MHNNYFLQVQTLINQKAIEAPGAKKLWCDSGKPGQFIKCNYKYIIYMNKKIKEFLYD